MNPDAVEAVHLDAPLRGVQPPILSAATHTAETHSNAVATCQ